MKRILFSLFLMAMSVMAGKASVVLNSTNFPDAVFRAYISSMTGVPVGGMISDVQLQSVKIIDVNGKGITSLKGVEYFTALTCLYCHKNQLTSLDVSHNTALTELECYRNKLTSLDVSQNSALTELSCVYNQLSSLDVSHNTALTYLSCGGNQLTSLDVSHNTALTSLICWDNQLSTLDVSHNTALTGLGCGSNQLTSLDVSHNTALTSLGCHDNQLTSLDVSHNTALTSLWCNDNQLSSLDVSQNTALTYLSCSYNKLPSLDVSHNTALTELYCHKNQLTSLDVSHNTALTTLYCNENQLPSLDVSHNTALTWLYCESNQLPSLDVSQNTALTHLSCGDNQLTSLDVSQNTALTSLRCYDNQLMSLDLSKCTKLESKITSVGSQSKSMVASSWGSNQYSIDVPADFDISKVYSFNVNSTSVTPTLSNGQLVFISSSTPTSITYQYDTSNSVAGMMKVSISITDIVDGTTSYDLTISATGNGSATYSGTSIRNKSQTFSVVEGTNATITFTPDAGYRIKSVKKNGTDVTSSVSNNKYTVSNISANTTVAVVFEVIPPTYYDLTISATGNGSAAYSGTSIRNKSQTFSVAKGTNATITFTPDTGYRIKSVKVGSTDVTSNVKNNQYTVSNIEANKTVTVVFEENVYDGFTADGITYHISSAALRTVEVKGVSTEHAVIPERVAQYDDTWKVTAIADGAFRDGQQLVSVSVPASIETVPDGLFTSCPRLCAVVWHASVPLTAGVLGAVTNPNLLVYVDSQEQTALSVPNIIVNGMAEEITLTEASDGNDFYCPAAFSARQVSYVRHFGMTTGIGECRGWESIVLPFSVQTFYHATRGELIPFAAWDGVHGKPFWLLSYGADGFAETGSLEANVPYIISMPNNPKYASDYNLSGDITFSARNAVVKASTEMAGVTGNGKTFVPSFAHEGNTADAFILNVNGSFVNYGGAYPEGSVFIRNLRDIRPFEAYFTNVQQAKEVLPVFDDETTPIREIPLNPNLMPRVTVYSVTGQLMKSGKNITIEEALQGLSRGVYIVNGQKYAVYEKGMEE